MATDVESNVEGSWAEAPDWESGDVPDCRSCKKPFKLTRRRHHCRGCGRVFCDDCTSKRFELPPSFKSKGKQRVCDDCYYLLIQMSAESNPDQYPPKPDIEKCKSESLERIKAVLAEPEETWTEKAKNKSVIIHSKKLAGSSVHTVRTISHVPCSVEKTWFVYNNKDLWINWQPDLKECRTIEKISETEEILYVLFLLPVLDNRDVVSYSCRIEGTVANPDQPRSKTLLGISTTHPLCPNIKGVVRAEMKMSMTTFEPITADNGDEHCRITTILHADIRGLVPPMIVNQAVSRSAGQILDMIHFMEAFKMPQVASV